MNSGVTECPPGEKLTFQQEVDHRFTVLADYWRDLYAEKSLFGVIHQERHTRALAWLRGLKLPQGAHILELGCGAGVQAVAFAECGYIVDGLDSAAAMVELATKMAEEQGVGGSATFVQGDAHKLPYDDASFDFVSALGVLPYLYDPEAAMGEIARVLKPGGSFLVSSHNAHRLSHLLDPRFSIFIRPVKVFVHRITGGRFRHTAPVRAFSLGALCGLLTDSSFSIVRCESFGFGPFSLFGHEMFSEPKAIALHRRLQSLADRGVPILGRTGNQHLVLARLSR